MKIYTKKGDRGQTSLLGGGPLAKDHPRIQAYGTVDELNCVIGCALADLAEKDLCPKILEVQKQLFVLGAELATVAPGAEMTKGFIQGRHIQALENQIDDWEKELKPLKKFILPGGVRAAAGFHLARTICRRAERLVVALSHQESLRPETIQFLNRLSDWLFVLARVVNRRAEIEDILWEGILK